MVTNETLFHTDPLTGAPQPIGLGWLDDSMTPNGPTEEDPNYISDTGASQADMASQVAAYQESMQALIERVIPLGGFFWQLMDGGGAKLNTGLNTTLDTADCLAHLRSICVPQPPNWKRFQLYNLPNGGFGASLRSFTDYTAVGAGCACVCARARTARRFSPTPRVLAARPRLRLCRSFSLLAVPMPSSATAVRADKGGLAAPLCALLPRLTRARSPSLRSPPCRVRMHRRAEEESARARVG